MTPEDRAAGLLKSIFPYQGSDALWESHLDKIAQAFRECRIEALEEGAHVANIEFKQAARLIALKIRYLKGDTPEAACLIEDRIKEEDEREEALNNGPFGVGA